MYNSCETCRTITDSLQNKTRSDTLLDMCHWWIRNCLLFFRSTWNHSWFYLNLCCSIFSILCSVLSSLLVFGTILFRFAIALSVLRFTAFSYPFGIFKPFRLQKKNIKYLNQNHSYTFRYA
jgi:hypothetical protein